MKNIKKKKSNELNKQQNLWKGSFGDSYIKRNSSLDQINEVYKKTNWRNSGRNYLRIL